jgi:sterol desaturase/sphingolipid hydroxylase (fatty acid hydroxylase superfamily)
VLVPLVVLAAAVVMIVVERTRPGRAWPEVAGWWRRALAFNGLQALTVLTISRALDARFADARPVWATSLDALGPTGGALVGYVALTFVYYWWHRARHEVPLLWRWLHQLHHSPQRLEVLTSFYKHPLELVTNSVIPGVVLYLAVGVGAEAATGATCLAGLAELFYHWNVRTPRWLGFVIQRPESHCVHHEEGEHRKNYGDLPVWDMIFGTFENPAVFDRRCGLGAGAEERVLDLLAGRDVVTAPPAQAPALAHGERRAALAAGALLALGVAQMLADAAGSTPLRALAAATAASPAPKVFTAVRGYEPLSTTFQLEWVDASGEARCAPVDAERVAGLRGPYNRRNVYGAALAFGPALASDARTRPLLEAVLARALAGDASILAELGVDPRDVRGLRVRYAVRSDRDLRGMPEVITAEGTDQSDAGRALVVTR